MTSDMTLLVIAHRESAPLAVLGPAAAAQALRVDVVRPVLGEVLPGPRDHAAVVVLGGPQSAYDEVAHPYLADEIAFLTDVHEAGVPLLAICLGAQLLSRALGGEARPGESGLECGLVDVKAVHDEGTALEGRYFSFHSDTMSVPCGATVLAESDRYIQAWRAGTSLAVQFHPELDRSDMEAVLDAEEHKLAHFGVDVAALRAELDTQVTDTSQGRRLIDRWMTTRSTRL